MLLRSFLLLVLAAWPATALDTTLVARGSVWKFLDDGSDAGTAWRTPGFDDSSWSSGPAMLGYGEPDVATPVSFGPNASNKYATTYFRSSFTVTDPNEVARLELGLRRDDGAVVYVNGVEVHRANLAAGPVAFNTFANAVVGGAEEGQFVATTIGPAALVAGNNSIAVEVHQANATSSDLIFDLELIASDAPFDVRRGPYWQMATPTSLVVRWRTDVATDSRVRYGTALDALSHSVADATLTTEHELQLTGLTPDTLYYFSIGSATDEVLPPSPAQAVRTPPVVGSEKPTRVWVVGDAGTADGNQAAVRDAFVTYAGARPADLWLMLGDNAYNNGTDSEYQAGVFDMYADQLRTAPVWPTFGNHDAGSASSASQTGVYYDIFTLPTLGQAGGEPSGTEAYYSFDYGNIHFICLDSTGSSRSPGSAMLTWLEADLEATSAQWVIAFWHHPPYSKGSHDSDFETELVQMRQNVVPILEAYGVDLVLTGHSHSYERSFLLDGHYGLSTSLTSAMLVDAGDGRADGDGAYRKTGHSLVPHEGAVYVVAGSSGRLDPVGQHAAMFVAWEELGSLVLDVEGTRLDATFVGGDGQVRDRFRIDKNKVTCAATPRVDCRVPARTTLSIRDRARDEADALAWNWTKGEATTLADFGAPHDTSDYAVCIYTGGDLAAQVDAPASAEQWSVLRRGFKYANRNGSATGASKLTLASGEAGRAAIRVRAGGVALPPVPLPMTTPVTVQLTRSDATTCWQSTFEGDDVAQNTGDAFKARASAP